MNNDKKYKNKYGRTTVLTLNVLYTLSIVTFLHSMFCYFFLDIKEVLFKVLLAYSIVNTINILLFYYHKKILLSYNLGSILSFVGACVMSLYSGGINSPILPFLVLLIYFAYLIGEIYGNLWFVVVTLTVICFYIFDLLNVSMVNEIDDHNMAEFNLIFLLFLLILLGGVFGRMMNKINLAIKKAKQEIVYKNDEKSIMLKEIHHRVKNNLQTVNSLLRIQARGVDDPKVQSMFKMAQSRIVAMARLHEKIYNTNDFKHIDVNEYIKLLIDDLINSYNLDKEITATMSVDSLKMSIDTLLPLSLIINEFVSNSLKHAFKDKVNGEVYVELKNNHENNYELIIGDNGVGISDDEFLFIENSTGMILIKTFVKQLKGKIEKLKTDQGTLFKISFLGAES
ncbi:sensor histidine kinase [Pseudofulvibacter geojedonensis]|uniref:histidine kinase n=1 Tax=Pseudofulvibacter geojedonensis TaxID=1123758 RepID=A0ABW3HYB4_9FLAO